MTEQTEKKHSTFGVGIDPTFDEDGKWTGEITAFVEEDICDDLSEDERMKIRSVVGMMASTLQLMEHDEDFLDYVRSYFITNFTDMIAEFLEDAEDAPPSFSRSEDGKVITLNFNTKTYGNA